MKGRDIKALFSNLPDDAEIYAKKQGYPDLRPVEKKDFNCTFTEEPLVLVEDVYSHNNEPFKMLLIDKNDNGSEPLKMWSNTSKRLSSFKGIILSKTVKP